MSLGSVKYATAVGCLAALSCGAPSRDTEFGGSNTVGLYLEAVKPILQDLRLLERQIEDAVPADNVESHVIVPLIEEQFLPQLKQLRERAQQLPTTAELLATNSKLLAYLGLRIRGVRPGSARCQREPAGAVYLILPQTGRSRFCLPRFRDLSATGAGQPALMSCRRIKWGVSS